MIKFCPYCGNYLSTLAVSGRDRLACTAPKCGFVHWNNPIPVVAGIVECEDHIILVRNVGWPETWYGLVTGFLESGEMPEEGILREVQEEIGLEAELQSYIGMYEFYRSNQLLIAYHVTVESRQVNLCQEEIADAKWIPVEEVEPWSAGTGKAVKDWLKGKGIERELKDFARANRS